MCDSDSDSHSDNTNEEIVEKKEVLDKKVQTELEEMVEEVAESLLNLSNGVSKKKYPLLEKYGIYDMPFFTPDGIYTPINKMTTELFKKTLGSKIVKDLNDYEKFHKNVANKQIHFHALSVNMFYTLALISCLNSTYIKYDLLLYVGYVLYYRWYGSVFCSIFMGSFLSNVVIGSKAYTCFIPNHFWYSFFMVAMSWFAQFYGHIVYERNQPALTTSLTQALTIAPVHLAVESVERMGGVQEITEGFLRTQGLIAQSVMKFQNWWSGWDNNKNKKD
jgi:uncharacterized membrane protein YGL010W